MGSAFHLLIISETPGFQSPLSSFSCSGERDEPAPIRTLRAKFIALGRVMVQFLKRRANLDRPLEEKMFDVAGRQARSMILENGGDQGDEMLMFRSQGTRMGQPIGNQQIGSVFDRSEIKAPLSRPGKEGAWPRCGSGHCGLHSGNRPLPPF